MNKITSTIAGLLLLGQLVTAQDMLRSPALPVPASGAPSTIHWKNVFENKSDLQADILWPESVNNSSWLQGSFDGRGTTLFSDLVSDNFGVVRVTLSAAVNSDQKDTAADLKTFLNGGGNAMLRGIIPLVMWRQNPAGTAPPAGQFGVYAKPSLFFTVPALGGQIEDPQFGGQLQLEAQFSAVGSKGLLGINSRCMMGLAGGTGPWTDTVLGNSSDVFAYGVIGFGLIIRESYTLSFAKSFGLWKADVFTRQKATITLSANF